jgi:chromosome partitioning protein
MLVSAVGQARKRRLILRRANATGRRRIEQIRPSVLDHVGARRQQKMFKGEAMKTLVLANRKGGVGTTATSCQFAFYLVHRGLRVLLADFDHQGNSSRCLARSGLSSTAPFSSSMLLAGQAGASDALPSASLVVVPADDDLSTLERQPDRHNAFVNVLHDFLASVASQFDVCVIDTNPNPDIRYAAALLSANYLLSPIELKQEAIDGIGALLHHGRYGVQRVKRALNPGLDFIGILPTMVEANAFQRANLQQLVMAYPSLLIPVHRDGVAGYAFVPNRTAVAEAQAAGVPLWQLRSGGEGGTAGPVRGAARDAWREIKPSYEAIARRMGLD